MDGSHDLMIALNLPQEELEQLEEITRNLSSSIGAEGISVDRAHQPIELKPYEERRSDLSSLCTIVVALINAGAVTAVVNALRAIFASSPKTLTATITINGKTLTLDAKNIDEKKLEHLTALLTEDAPEWAA
jgi:hypothetical protein